MLGTIVNTCTIIIGSIVGTVLHRGIKEKYKRVLYDGLGLASLAIGLNATITHLPKSQYPVLFIISIALGGIIGTRLDINGRFHRLVERRGILYLRLQKNRQHQDAVPPSPTGCPLPSCSTA